MIIKANKKYYIYLIDRIWKMIPMYEENKKNCFKYMRSICLELSGNEDDFQEIIQIKNKINGLIIEKENVEHGLLRGTILDCVGILDKMLSNWGD